MDEFAEKLGAALKASGLSVAEFARECGVSRQYVYRVLDGQQMPSMAMAERMAETVGLKIRILSESA